MKDFILVIVSLLTLNIIQTGCIILYPDGDTVIGENGKSVTFRWNIVNIQQFHNMEFFHNNIDRTKALTAATIRFNQDVVLVSSNPRLTPGSCYFPNNNGTCNFTLSNLKYEDSGLYYGVEFSGTQKVTEKSVTLNVTGGPDLCGSERLPQNFTCNPGQTITGNVTLCGKPKPIVTWYRNNKVIPGEPVDENLQDQHQYTYSFQFKTDSNMCGQIISYKAAGIYDITGTSTILLEKSEEKKPEKKKYGGIIGGVVGALAVIIVVIIIVVLHKKGKLGCRRSASTEPKDEDAHMSTDKV